MKTIKIISILVLVSLITKFTWAQTTIDNRSFYKAFEMSVSDGLNLQATAKVGIKPVYGLFSVGTQFLAENYKWAFWSRRGNSPD